MRDILFNVFGISKDFHSLTDAEVVNLNQVCLSDNKFTTYTAIVYA